MVAVSLSPVVRRCCERDFLMISYFPTFQLQSAFKDKEDENQRLKTYIDTILLNIVENYPQLLEVKGNGSSAIAMSFSK